MPWDPTLVNPCCGLLETTHQSFRLSPFCWCCWCRQHLLYGHCSRLFDMIFKAFPKGFQTVRYAHEQAIHSRKICMMSLVASQKRCPLTVVAVCIEQRLELVPDDLGVRRNEGLFACIFQLWRSASQLHTTRRSPQLTSFLVTSFKYRFTRSASSCNLASARFM